MNNTINIYADLDWGLSEQHILLDIGINYLKDQLRQDPLEGMRRAIEFYRNFWEYKKTENLEAVYRTYSQIPDRYVKETIDRSNVNPRFLETLDHIIEREDALVANIHVLTRNDREVAYRFMTKPKTRKILGEHRAVYADVTGNSFFSGREGFEREAIGKINRYDKIPEGAIYIAGPEERKHLPKYEKENGLHFKFIPIEHRSKRSGFFRELFQGDI